MFGLSMSSAVVMRIASWVSRNAVVRICVVILLNYDINQAIINPILKSRITYVN